MNAENFCYWLRGRTEDRDLEPPSRDEWQLILDHLGLVFGVEPPVRAVATDSCMGCGTPEGYEHGECCPERPQPGPAEQWEDQLLELVARQKAEPYQLNMIPPTCAHAEFQAEYGTKIDDPVVVWRCVACGYKKPYPEAQRSLVC